MTASKVTVSVEINSHSGEGYSSKGITLYANSCDSDVCWADVRQALQDFLNELQYGL